MSLVSSFNWSSAGSLVLGVALCGGLLAYGITEEVPIGGIHGRVTMKENGRPLPNAMVTLMPVGPADEEMKKSRYIETDEEGKFNVGSIASGYYELSVSGTAHNFDRQVVNIKEGKAMSSDIEAVPIPSYLELYASQRVFTPAEQPSFQIKGFFDADTVKITAYKLDFAKVVKKGSLYNALSPLARAYGTDKIDDPKTMGTAVSNWDQKISGRDAEGTFIQAVETKDLPEGLYWVQCKGPNLTNGTWFSVSKIGLVAKHVGKNTTCFVSALDTGKPIAGASIGYANKGVYTEIAKTSSEGLASFTADASDAVLATYGDSKALVSVYSENDTASQIHTYIYTDRPVYRPGDQISYKGIIRQLAGPEYSLPKGGNVTVQVLDSQENEIQKASLPLTGNGTFASDFTLNKEAEPGYYSIVATYGGEEFRQGVSVAAYRKPQFSIAMKPEKPVYTKGDTVRMNVEVQYYFGGPVPGAKIQADVYKEFYWDPSLYGDDYAEYFEEGDGYGYGGEYVETVELTTDDNGKAVIEFDTTPEEPKAEEASSDYRYNVTAAITDDSGQYFDGKGSVKVLRGTFGLSVETGSYVSEPGKPITATVKAFDFDNEKPLANVEVEVVSGMEIWDKTGVQMVQRNVQKVTTNAEGIATVTLTPSRGGSYSIEARANDSRGNSILAESWLWVTGAGEGYGAPVPELTIELDKKQYKVGDTATALIKSDQPGGSALVTVEGDKIYEAKVVPLDGKVTTVDLAVLDKYAPNAFVSIAYIKDKKFGEATRRLNVDLGRRKLNIELTSDKEKYGPGETATYSIKTTTEAGTPTPAEVSLGVVDEAVYAIAEDTTDIAAGFYPKRYNRVETQYSFPDLYLDGGDKAPTSIEVRKLFKDTAKWIPAVQTDAQGMATVEVQLPDNLTTWRATAWGITKNTEVGKAVGKVKTSKDLMVRLQGPQYMVVKDEQQVTALLSNSTDKPLEVNVELTAQGVVFDGNRVSKVSVAPGGTSSVLYTLKPNASGEATLVAKAWVDNGPTDGVELKMPVKAHGRTFVDTTSGIVRGRGTTKVSLRPNADPNEGSLTISVAPSIATSLVQTLDQLIDFPYGCVEQTMSRFMPAVVVSKAVQDAGLPRPARANDIPAIVADSYTRLYKMQHGDGGWGWWEYDSSTPYMTAYVLEGMYRAKNAGYKFNDFSVNKAVAWAKQYLKTPVEKYADGKVNTGDVTDRYYLAYTISLHGAGAEATVALQGLKPEAAGEVDATNALLAYTTLGNAPRRDAFLNRLVKLANVTGDVAFWKEGYWGVETTSRALLALTSVKADHPLVQKAVRYLMSKRRGDWWWSTRDSSTALIALSKYFAITKELVASGEITVSINGSQISRMPVTEGTIFGPESKIRVPLNQLKAGDNTVEITRTGGGVCYYGTEIKQVSVQDELGELLSTPGLKIQRAYYKLEPQRLENGSMKLMPSKQAVTSASPGDILRVQITVTTDKPRYYMIVEDPFPANCRITERTDLMEGESWSWWWSRTSIFDDRVALFAREVPADKPQVFEYTMRVETAGAAHALPATAYNMYDPDIRASSGETILEVRK